MSTPMTALIADDESLARRTLRQYLAELGWPGEIYDAHDGAQAVELANARRPGLVFLDIVMPAGNGLQVLEKLTYRPQVIFTTAHDEYAVTAFELGALDYVLKPFGRERLARVLERVHGVCESADVALSTRAREALDSTRMLSRIFVRDGSRILPIPIASLERAEGADDYIVLHTVGKQYLVSVRLTELETRLPQSHFLRIHRSHIVNLEFVTAIEPFDAARLEVVLKTGTRIVASRAGSKRLRELAM